MSDLRVLFDPAADGSYHAQLADAKTADLAAAAEWAKKRDDLLAELERRAGGGGGLPAQMLKALQALTVACAEAGFGGGGLGPTEEEALAHLGGLPAPFSEFADFLRQIAGGELPPITDGLSFGSGWRGWWRRLGKVRDELGPSEGLTRWNWHFGRAYTLRPSPSWLRAQVHLADNERNWQARAWELSPGKDLSDHGHNSIG